uniref:hypothetical protein n=1 Tax=Arthrobacter silvisoli TaxID=2291022 RepID=UPI003F4909B4
MTENEHYTRAKSKLHNGTDKEVARAQAEATLALAFEQRTANLIAMLQLTQGYWAQGEVKPIAKEIQERLGL